MLSTKTALRHLAAQGGDLVKLTVAADALATAQLTPSDSHRPLNAEQVVALLLGCCSPVPQDAARFALERAALHSEGVSLRAALIDCLSEDNPPACVDVLHQQPHVTIFPLADADPAEFGTPFNSGGFGSKTVISGGLFSLLAMKLNDRP